MVLLFPDTLKIINDVVGLWGNECFVSGTGTKITEN